MSADLMSSYKFYAPGRYTPFNRSVRQGMVRGLFLAETILSFIKKAESRYLQTHTHQQPRQATCPWKNHQA